MISESTQKQVLLISGILTAVGGVVLYAAIMPFGVWMLVKWRTRHSRLLKPGALRLERDNAEHAQ